MKIKISIMNNARLQQIVCQLLAFAPAFVLIALAVPRVQSEDPRFAGRIRAIVVRPDNPDVIWVAAASGGFWKSSNGGADWSQADDFLPALTFSSLTIDPQNANVLYAGTGELHAFLFHLDRMPATLADIEGLALRNPMRGAGIVKTTDGGTKWNVLPFTANNPNFCYVNRIAVHPLSPNIALAGHLHRSLAERGQRGFVAGGGFVIEQNHAGCPVSSDEHRSPMPSRPLTMAESFGHSLMLRRGTHQFCRVA